MKIIRTKSDFRYTISQLLETDFMFLLLATRKLKAGYENGEDWHRETGRFKNPIREFLENASKSTRPVFLISGDNEPVTKNLSCKGCRLAKLNQQLDNVIHKDLFPGIESLFVEGYSRNYIATDKIVIFGNRSLWDKEELADSYVSSSPEIVSKFVNHFWLDWDSLSNSLKAKPYNKKNIQESITEQSNENGRPKIKELSN